MKYIVDMTLEVEETMALNVERSNSTNFNFDTYNSLTPNWYYKVLR